MSPLDAVESFVIVAFLLTIIAIFGRKQLAREAALANFHGKRMSRRSEARRRIGVATPKKVRWLLPDDRIVESETENLTEFVYLLKEVHVVAYQTLNYKVARIELVVEDECWLCVSLE